MTLVKFFCSSKQPKGLGELVELDQGNVIGSTRNQRLRIWVIPPHLKFKDAICNRSYWTLLQWGFPILYHSILWMLRHSKPFAKPWNILWNYQPWIKATSWLSLDAKCRDFHWTHHFQGLSLSPGSSDVRRKPWKLLHFWVSSTKIYFFEIKRNEPLRMHQERSLTMLMGITSHY